MGGAVRKGFLEERYSVEEHSRLQWETSRGWVKGCGGRRGNTEMGVLIRNWEDGHEAQINMQNRTSEDPTDQARNEDVFK